MDTLRRIKVLLIALAIVFLSAGMAMSGQQFSGFGGLSCPLVRIGIAKAP